MSRGRLGTCRVLSRGVCLDEAEAEIARSVDAGGADEAGGVVHCTELDRLDALSKQLHVVAQKGGESAFGTDFLRQPFLYHGEMPLCLGVPSWAALGSQ